MYQYNKGLAPFFLFDRPTPFFFPAVPHLGKVIRKLWCCLLGVQDKFKPQTPCIRTGIITLPPPPKHNENYNHYPLVSIKSVQTSLGACPALSWKPQRRRNEIFHTLWSLCGIITLDIEASFGREIDPTLCEQPQDNGHCEQDGLTMTTTTWGSFFSYFCLANQFCSLLGNMHLGLLPPGELALWASLCSTCGVLRTLCYRLKWPKSEALITDI